MGYMYSSSSSVKGKNEGHGGTEATQFVGCGGTMRRNGGRFLLLLAALARCSLARLLAFQQQLHAVGVWVNGANTA